MSYRKVPLLPHGYPPWRIQKITFLRVIKDSFIYKHWWTKQVNEQEWINKDSFIHLYASTKQWQVNEQKLTKVVYSLVCMNKAIANEWARVNKVAFIREQSNRKWVSKSERVRYYLLACMDEAMASEWAKVNADAFIHWYAWAKQLQKSEQEWTSTLSFISMREQSICPWMSRNE